MCEAKQAAKQAELSYEMTELSVLELNKQIFQMWKNSNV